MLTQLSMSVLANWTLQQDNPDSWQPTVYGPDGMVANFASIDLTVQNNLFLDYIELASGASTTLTLANLIDYVGEEFTPTQLWAFFLIPQTYVWTVQPGASNGLQIWGGSGVTLPIQPEVGLLYPWLPGGTPLTVSGTANELKFTNTGGETDYANLALVCYSASDTDEL